MQLYHIPSGKTLAVPETTTEFLIKYTFASPYTCLCSGVPISAEIILRILEFGVFYHIISKDDIPPITARRWSLLRHIKEEPAKTAVVLKKYFSWSDFLVIED